MMNINEVRRRLTYNKNTGVFIWNIDLDAGNIKAGDVAGYWNKSKKMYQVKLNRVKYSGARLAILITKGYIDNRPVFKRDGDAKNLKLSNLYQKDIKSNAIKVDGKAIPKERLENTIYKG